MTSLNHKALYADKKTQNTNREPKKKIVYGASVEKMEGTLNTH